MDYLFETDADLLALFAEAEIFIDQQTADIHASFAAFTGVDVSVVYANLANGLIVAGARLVVGQPAARDSGRALRHARYSTGELEAPRRLTRAQQLRLDDRAFGLCA